MKKIAIKVNYGTEVIIHSPRFLGDGFDIIQIRVIDVL